MNNIVFFSEEDLDKKDYLLKICSFNKNNIKITNINKYNPIYKVQGLDKGLWAIFGKQNNTWSCLEVGSSKDINKELRDNLNAMITKPYYKKKESVFHGYVYDFLTYMDKHSVKYRAMYKMCEEFIIYEINIEKYLKGVDCPDCDSVNYAEVSFAFETKAKFWNPAPPMNGNCEKKIYNQMIEKITKNQKNYT